LYFTSFVYHAPALELEDELEELEDELLELDTDSELDEEELETDSEELDDDEEEELEDVDELLDDELSEYELSLVELEDSLPDEELTPPLKIMNGDCVLDPFLGVTGAAGIGAPSVLNMNFQAILSVANAYALDAWIIKSLSPMQYSLKSARRTSPE